MVLMRWAAAIMTKSGTISAANGMVSNSSMKAKRRSRMASGRSRSRSPAVDETASVSDGRDDRDLGRIPEHLRHIDELEDAATLANRLSPKSVLPLTMSADLFVAPTIIQ